MLKFYYRIFWSAVSDYKDVTSKCQIGAAIALALLGYLSPRWATIVSFTWKGLSPWWSVLPLGLFIGYRLLRANYLAFVALEKRLAAQQDEEEIQSRLGELLNKGSELRVEEILSESHLSAWVSRFDGWMTDVLDALGTFGLAADYSLFQNADTMEDQAPKFADEWQEQVHFYDRMLKSHMRTLAGIIRTRPKLRFPPVEGS